MKLELRLMTQTEAREIIGWHYPDPYAVYDPGPDAASGLLDIQNNYYAVFDEDGALVGFFCFGRDAQVPGSLSGAEAADATTLDVGLGMRPDLAGRGQGLDFLNAGLAFARDRFHPVHFRLSVYTFNRRAIAVYVRGGFEPVRVFQSPGPNGDREFLLMSRKA